MTGGWCMTNNRRSRIIKLAARILKSWTTEEQQKYPGGIWHADGYEWNEPYGTAIDDQIPDFVKKDNDGWDYVAQYKGD